MCTEHNNSGAVCLLFHPDFKILTTFENIIVYVNILNVPASLYAKHTLKDLFPFLATDLLSIIV
jgi:hypothetical protein